jgi:glycosyltransferase involved in cell wall biosynthesis
MINENKKLKIAVISFDWRNIFENNFEELVRKLKRDRLNPDLNDFFFISWSSKKYHKKVNNIETVHFKAPFGRRILCDFLSDFMVPIILRRYNFQPDIVLVYDFPLIFSAVWAKILWRSKTVLFLGNLPTGLTKTRKFAGFQYLYQKSAEFAGKYFVDLFVAISESTKNYLKDLKIKEEKIRTITPDILERDKEFILNSKKGVIRQNYDIADSRKVLLSVGRLEPEKGLDELIEVFKSLDREDLVLMIVGEGSRKQKLAEKIIEKSLEGKIILAGFQDREEIWNFYQDADIFILLSRTEGLGLAFWEAMYMGVPVIGTDIDGIRETIGADGERGFYWKNDLGDLKNKLEILLDNTSIEKQSVVGRAKDYVRKKLESKADINSLLI